MTTDSIELPPLPVRYVTKVDVTGAVRWETEEGPYTADQMREYALLAIQQERERILNSEVVQFLYGAGELDGVGFTEVPVGKPRYWWRSILRATIRG